MIVKKKESFLPYGRQHINDDDIAAVSEVLRSDWLTCGPAGPAFEGSLCQTVESDNAIACSSGTAALHLAMLALGIGPGDVVITSPISFLASANCARYVGAEVWFADIDPETGLISVESLAKLLGRDSHSRVKAVIPVHLAGQPADMQAIYKLAENHGIKIVEDACHALGGSYSADGKTVPVGSCEHSDLTVFSFHPVKHVAMGEGGAVTTNDSDVADRLRRFRNHGIERERFVDSDLAYNSTGKPNPWYYEMSDLGYNYRLSDIQSTLGQSQLHRLKQSVTRRREIAGLYTELISEQFNQSNLRPLLTREYNNNAYHLYITLIDFEFYGKSRYEVMTELKKHGVGTQVHYIPIFLQPYYRDQSLEALTDCPYSLKYYESALSLPMYPELTDDDCKRVIGRLSQVLDR
ncbi:MAG: UDP-4-amino-4,6-dideoxy-N-acetyl-beta-L-altrosamine transaminase [candidate division Zixibacteria bacterium]|nr:UDP-4-amino-4,6-dideoxy-N-acetyl-beta-L-altrosamine transaminase [candidate division Zixibacteria bacterium]